MLHSSWHSKKYDYPEDVSSMALPKFGVYMQKYTWCRVTEGWNLRLLILSAIRFILQRENNMRDDRLPPRLN